MSSGSDIRQARLQAWASVDRLPSDIARAERLAAAIGRGQVVACCGRGGGGALLALVLRGHAVALDAAGVGADGLGAALRSADPPVVGRIEEGRVLIDVRTLADEELDPAAAVVRNALP